MIFDGQNGPPSLKSFSLKGLTVFAVDLVDGVFIDPDLPDDFDTTDNSDRPPEQMIWWGVPFIRTHRSNEPGFLKQFPDGVQYETRCLDGGAWDRSTWWGAFETLAKAVERAKAGPSWRKR